MNEGTETRRIKEKPDGLGVLCFSGSCAPGTFLSFGFTDVTLSLTIAPSFA